MNMVLQLYLGKTNLVLPKMYNFWRNDRSTIWEEEIKLISGTINQFNRKESIFDSKKEPV